MSESPPATNAAWPAVEQATRAITTGQGTLQTLADLVRALSAVGLESLIEPTVKAINLPGQAWETQRAAILQEVRKLSPTKVIWQTYSQLFKDNLAALLPNNPSLSRLADLWPTQQSRFDLHRAADGNFQIVDTNAPSLFAGLLGGLTDHRALTRQWMYQCTGLQAIRPFAFDGAGYGWVLIRALETTNETFLNYSCPVYVLEPDPATICMLLHMHDLRRWSRRLRFFVGDDAVLQFRRELARRPDWMLPTAIFADRLQSRPSLIIQPTLTALTEQRSQHEESLNTQIRAHYEPLTPAYWSARYAAALAGGKPLKIMGITTRYSTVLQYSMEELGAAVRASGHEFILAKEADDQNLDRPDMELIARHKPDLLVLISRTRHENPQFPKNLPFLTWDQDNLACMRSPEVAKSLDAMTYIAGIGALAGYQNLNWPRRNCIFASLAASTHRYSNQPVDNALLQKHRCTFSFTSNASGTPESLAAELSPTYAANPRLLALFNETAAEVLSRANAGYVWDAIPLAKLLDQIITSRAISLDPSIRQEIILHLRRISDRAYRHVALRWVADYCRRKNLTLRLYGKGWESNPHFADFAAGFLAPGEEMRAVYQASDINLQLMETGFQHSRAFDGFAAGGFFLYRHGAETRELDIAADSVFTMAGRAQATGCLTFAQLEASTDPIIAKGWAHARMLIPPGKPDEICQMLDRWHPTGIDYQAFPYLDEITFSSQEQFNSMADKYLADPDLRHSVAAKLRQVVVDRFSYDARWREFLNGIASGLRNATADFGAQATRQAA